MTKLSESRALPDTANLMPFFPHVGASKVVDMNIPIESLKELARICDESFQRKFSEVELREVAQRIIRFLKNSPADGEEVGTS